MNELLYGLKFRNTSPMPELIFELFSALDLDYSSYEDKEGGPSYMMIYAETPEKFAADKAAFTNALTEWSNFGVSVDGMEEVQIKKEEWSEVWKKYFHILHIADNLVIKPSWLDYTAKPGEAVVEIDPGMSFGTGQHATTSFCLHKLAEFAGAGKVKSVLDAGCGSGILALAAAKLGYAPVQAFDYDPEAVTIAAENFALNHLTDADIELTQADVACFQPISGGYDLALVNILGHILKANARHITRLVHVDGYLALAGILSAEFDALSEAFVRQGCVEVERFTEKEWTSGLFIRQK